MNKNEFIKELKTIDSKEKTMVGKVKKAIELACIFINEDLTKDRNLECIETLLPFLSTDYFFKNTTKSFETSYKNVFRAKNGIKEFIFDNLPKKEKITGETDKLGNFNLYLWESIKPDKNLYRTEKQQYHDRIREKNQERREKQIQVDYQQYIDTTLKLLASDDVYENYVGLLAATARRPAELFRKNIFDKTNKDVDNHDYKLMFFNRIKNTDSHCICYSLIPSDDVIAIHKKITNHFDARLDHLYELSVSKIKPDEDDVDIIFRDQFNKSNERRKIGDCFKLNYAFLEKQIPTKEQFSVKLLRKIAAICLREKFFGLDDDQYNEDNLKLILADDTTDVLIAYRSYLTPNKDIVSNLQLPKTKKIKAEETKIAESTKAIRKNVNPLKIESQNKITESIFEIIEYNSKNRNPETQIAVTTNAIMTLTGAQSIAVKRYFEENPKIKELVEIHNKKYNFGLRQNVGKNIIKLLQK